LGLPVVGACQAHEVLHEYLDFVGVHLESAFVRFVEVEDLFGAFGLEVLVLLLTLGQGVDQVLHVLERIEGKRLDEDEVEEFVDRLVEEDFFGEVHLEVLSVRTFRNEVLH